MPREFAENNKIGPLTEIDRYAAESMSDYVYADFEKKKYT